MTPIRPMPARSRCGSARTGREQTTVELEHRFLDRLPGGQAIHDTIVFGGGGWTAILEQFAKAAATA